MPVLDRNGHPFPNKPETRELAVLSLRDRYSIYPSQGLTPERLASIFKEADQGYVLRQMELFEEMEEKDTHLASQLQTRKLAVQGLEWDIMPFSDDPMDKKIADFVTDVLDSFEDFDDLILDLMDAIGKGFSAAEIMWEVISGQAWINNIKWHHPKRFTFPINGDFEKLRLLTDEEPVNGIELPAGKFVVHRYKARSGHPSRAGVLRVCAWMYLFKNYDIKDWVAFAEVFGKPLRLGKYPEGATKEDKDALMQALVMLGTDAAGIVSANTVIDFIETKGTTGTNIYSALAEFCNKEISKAILGQTLTSEIGDKGSYGASKTHNEVRQDLKEADCKALAKTIKRDIIKPLVIFNFGDTRKLPWIKFHYEAPEDLDTTAKTYETLINVGLPIATEHIYDRFGIPKPSDGQQLITPPKPQGIMALPNKMPFVLKDVSTVQPPTYQESQQTVDDLADRVLSEGVAAIRTMATPLIKIIEEADSLEGLKEKLIAAYPDLPAAQFEDLLARSLFIADLFGRWAAGGQN